MTLNSFLGGAFIICSLLVSLGACAQDINPFELKAKADSAVAMVQELAAEGHDVSEILPKMKQVKVLGDAGRLEEADALLDEIHTWLEAKSSGSNDVGLNNEVFVNNIEVEILGYASDVMEPFISRDGKYMFFNSDHEPIAEKDIYYATRIDDYTFQFKGAVANINTKAVDGVPSMDDAGNFYYVSTDAYGPKNLVTVYRGKFKDGAVGNIKPIPELSLGIPGWLNMDIEISADGQTLYSTQTWFGDGAPPTKSYFFYAMKVGNRFVPQDDSPEIFKHINEDKVVYAATLSRDELEILYTRLVTEGSTHKTESLRATRPDKNSPFGRPRLIKAITGFSEAPALTDDGKLIYYHKLTHSPKNVFKLYALHRRDL